MTELVEAVRHNDLAMARRLLDKGARLEEATYVAEVLQDRNRIAFVRPFIEAGMDMEARDGVNNTALTLAVICNERELVDWLLARGADLEPKNGNGNTPLAMAALNGRPALMKPLLARGAALYAEFGMQKRLWQAGNSGDKEAVTRLLRDEEERRRRVSEAAAAWNSAAARTARKIAALKTKAPNLKPPQ